MLGFVGYLAFMSKSAASFANKRQSNASEPNISKQLSVDGALNEKDAKNACM